MIEFDNLTYLHGKPQGTGLLKANPEDFVVVEDLGFEPDGEGEHILVRILKNGCNTRFVADALAKFLKIHAREVSFDATPAEAQQVVYYSLAIGHHLGVIDCLEAALTCPWDEYLAWIATLEAGSEARRKMEGVPKYGEIVIDINHVPMLANAFDKARAAQTSQQKEWSTMLLSMLHDIHQENAIYLMVRRLRD